MARFWTLRLGFAVFFAGLLAVGQVDRSAGTANKRWYKGNLHTHTLNSDGDSTPHEVATWYRDQRYHFLVLTDHNYLTDVAGLNAIHGGTERFLLIPGEEVSASYDKKPIHINAFNPPRVIQPQRGDSVANTIQANVDEIRRANAIPSLNHPNFGWAITANDLMSVRDLGLFEVYNGHPAVNNPGGGGFDSLDEMWDALLSAGRELYGVAVDDAHVFKRFARGLSNPGHGWVEVRAEALTTDAILKALTAGDFYASTGVKIGDIVSAGGELRVQMETANWERLTTYFIGEGGKVLSRSYDKNAVYRFTGNEKYVRARVESSSGAKAWTQPVFQRAIRASMAKPVQIGVGPVSSQAAE